MQVLKISKRVFKSNHSVTIFKINDRALNHAWILTVNVINAWNDDDVLLLLSLTNDSTLKFLQDDDREIARKFITLLINDETLKALFQVTFEKIDIQRFCRNVIKILKDFVKNLR